MHTHYACVCLCSLLFYLYVHLTLSNVEYENTFGIATIARTLDDSYYEKEREREKEKEQKQICVHSLDLLVIFLFSKYIEFVLCIGYCCSFPFPFCLNGTIFFGCWFEFQIAIYIMYPLTSKNIVVNNLNNIVIFQRISNKLHSVTRTHTQPYISWVLFNMYSASYIVLQRYIFKSPHLTYLKAKAKKKNRNDTNNSR